MHVWRGTLKNQTANQHRFRENLQPSNSKFKQQRTFIIVVEQVLSIVLMASPEFEKIFLILLTMTTLLIKMSFLFRSVQYFLTRKKTANLLTQHLKASTEKVDYQVFEELQKTIGSKEHIHTPLTITDDMRTSFCYLCSYERCCGSNTCTW